MNILTDGNNNIISYATAGDFEGGIEISESVLPESFIRDFKSGKFKYENGIVEFNKGYVEFVESQNVQQAENENAMLRQEIVALNDKVDDLTNMITQLLAQINTPPE